MKTQLKEFPVGAARTRLTRVPASASVSFPGLVAPDRAAREEIQHRAYGLWIQAGKPAHQELDHWLAAEAEVISPSRP